MGGASNGLMRCPVCREVVEAELWALNRHLRTHTLRQALRTEAGKAARGQIVLLAIVGALLMAWLIVLVTR